MDGRKSLTKQFKKMSRTEGMFRDRDKAENRPQSPGGKGTSWSHRKEASLNGSEFSTMVWKL